MLWKKITTLSVEDALIECGTRKNGLFPREVKERQSRFGANEIRSRKSFWRDVVCERFRSSFLYLLLFAGLVSFILGERIEALLIGLFILINVSLETLQEYHSARTLQLLRRFMVSHVTVRRSGETLRIESRELVPGDIVLIEAGDRLAADVRFIEATGLALDESVMIGETAPIPKTGLALKKPTVEMHEAGNIGFAGTVVVSGKGIAVVLATGRETALGDAVMLSEETVRESVFEKELTRFSRFVLRLVFLTLSIIFVANVFIRGESIGVGELLVFSLALAVSVVPEALPVIATVSLSRGSLKLAQKKVIVKRLSAIEDLGSIDVLCADKTGTLTENTLVVSALKSRNERAVVFWAGVASRETPLGRASLHDPFDLALWNALSENERNTMPAFKRIDILPFDPARRRNSVLVRTGPAEFQLIVRGAFEEVLALSENLPLRERREWLAWGEQQGKAGERVLAVAMKTFSHKPKLSASLEKELTVLGLISFRDPLKKTASSTIREARHLGVQVKILTGDSREVAGAVAQAVGLVDQPRAVMTGEEFEKLSITLQREAVEQCAVFARVNPNQKFEILKLLQEKHEVGFLGEGINDAPALKLSNVAIVVQGASDIAREAADIVLLQRHLGTVIEGIREGRTIFSNIRKYLLITLTSNFGNFYSVALASLFFPFVPLLPIQILLLNLLSDFPMLALATDNVDHAELVRPRLHRVSSVILMATFLGAVSSLFDFMLFAIFVHDGPSLLQTAWFIMSVITEVILIFSLRTQGPFFLAKKPAGSLILLSAFVIGAVLYIPFTAMGQTLFHFQEPGLALFSVVLTLTLAYFVTTEVVKHFYVRHFDHGQLGEVKRVLA